MLTCGASAGRVVRLYGYRQVGRPDHHGKYSRDGGVAPPRGRRTLKSRQRLLALIATSQREGASAGTAEARTEAERALHRDLHGLQSERRRQKLASIIIDIEGKIATELQALDSAVQQRLRLGAQRAAAVAELAALHAKFQDTLVPLVDDAGFDLVITSEDLTTKSKEAIAGLIESGVDGLLALLTLRADGNLAAGLLAQAATVDDPALIPPFRERFSAAAAAVERNLGKLRDSPENERLRQASEALITIGSSPDNIFEARVQELRAAGETRRSLEGKRERMSAVAESAQRALHEKLTPMVDDAGFDLVTMSEDVTTKSTDAITGLVLGGVRTLQVLLTLRADGNLAAGLLNEAANVPDPAALPPLQERFDAAANHAKKLLGQLSAQAAEGPLRSLTETLIGFGASTGNLFDLRREELQKVAAAQASLERSSSLLLQLGKEVTDLVATAQSNSDEATLRLAKAIRNGKLLLLLITAASLAGAILIATRYVIAQVVEPIERITRAMSGLAAGDTAIDVPGRDRTDEIGRMADALGVFRDTAIELQKANQREIHEGRQRLAVAIESISEAFSLYDSEDKLVLCNSKYQTLLYPGGGVDISPGMSFETILRRFAENGYIKEAEGRVEDWIRERIARHQAPTGPHVQHRREGQWILVSERKTDDGSIVAVYSDITELKQRETQLAEKTRSLEQLSTQLAKYLAPQVYESIFTGKQEVKIASRRKKLTVFFSDVVGFTETADRLASEDVTRLVNHYLTEMSRIALSYGATIDKYVGDAIVIFFGDPETRGINEDALACVEMAIAMRKRMRELHEE